MQPETDNMVAAAKTVTWSAVVSSLPRRGRCSNDFVLILLILLVSSACTDACFRRQASSSDTTDTFVTAAVSDSTTEASHHRKVCSLEEEYEADCFNGGICHVVELAGNIRRPLCQCPEGFQGKQCEDRHFEPWPSTHEERMQAALIFTGIAAVIVILILLLMVAAYFWRRHRNRSSNLHIKNNDQQPLDKSRSNA